MLSSLLTDYSQAAKTVFEKTSSKYHHPEWVFIKIDLMVGPGSHHLDVDT